MADQPWLSARDFDAMIDRLAERPGSIVHASYAGVRGTPVLFAGRFRDALLRLRGREGGREVMRRNSAQLCAVELDPRAGRDLDRPDDLREVDRDPVDGARRAATLGRAMQRTLSIVKPDAVEQNRTGAILQRIEESGLRIIALRRLRLSREQAEGFYAVHRERPFFHDLVAFMTSGPVVVSVLEAEDAINRYRQLMGATNPAEADPGTLRKQFASNIERNAVHGSDAPETAATEIAYFFSSSDLIGG
jgi:nucleoside-diphosphate kinase